MVGELWRRRIVVGATAIGALLSAGAAHATTFVYTGAEQPFPVPANVSSIHVVAVGAPGGTSSSTSAYGAGAGGFGATATADLAVTPGETLYVEVGGAGMLPPAAAFNGGGLGGFYPHPGGGGGGASDVRTVSMAAGQAASLASRVVVAGGGGGGGSQTAAGGGAGGGATGGTGTPNTSGSSGGLGGTQNAGGGVGTCGGSTAPTAGAAGIGGNGGTSATTAGGGGGGGGYYGGGGGGQYCGGGGGSGYFGAGTSNTSFTPDATGNPSITLSYTVNPAISITAPATTTYTRAQVVDASYACSPATGTTLTGCTGTVASGAPIDTSTPGPHTFTVTAIDADGGTATDTITYRVLAPPTISITSPASGATFTQGQVVDAAYTCTAATGTTIASCTGPAPSGSALDTGTTGTHSFKVTAADALGGTTTQSVAYTVTSRGGGGGGGSGGRGGSGAGAPTLSLLRESARRWREHGPRHAHHKPPLGTTFSFELNQAATVTFTFTRTRKHHRSVVGTVTVTLPGGHDTVRFKGRTARGHVLKPGNYRLSAIASNANGHSAAVRPLTFTIIK